jgi:hypothetical protein
MLHFYLSESPKYAEVTRPYLQNVKTLKIQ